MWWPRPSLGERAGAHLPRISNTMRRPRALEPPIRLGKAPGESQRVGHTIRLCLLKRPSRPNRRASNNKRVAQLAARAGIFRGRIWRVRLRMVCALINCAIASRPPASSAIRAPARPALQTNCPLILLKSRGQPDPVRLVPREAPPLGCLLHLQSLLEKRLIAFTERARAPKVHTCLAVRPPGVAHSSQTSRLIAAPIKSAGRRSPPIQEPPRPSGLASRRDNAAPGPLISRPLIEPNHCQRTRQLGERGKYEPN